MSRWVILIGGAIVLAGVFAEKNPDFAESPPKSLGDACGLLMDAKACNAPAAILAVANANPNDLAKIPVLPDKHTTKGAIVPAITQANIDTTICNPQYVAAITPPPSWQEQAKTLLISKQFGSMSREFFAVDHLVPISLGGAPRDARNVWLQGWAGDFSAVQKDALESTLNSMVCNGQIPLHQAQKLIADNWIALYQHISSGNPLQNNGPALVPDNAPAIPQNHDQSPVTVEATLNNSAGFEVPEIPVR